jgi:hypothetical protein
VDSSPNFINVHYATIREFGGCDFWKDYFSEEVDVSKVNYNWKKAIKNFQKRNNPNKTFF